MRSLFILAFMRDTKGIQMKKRSIVFAVLLAVSFGARADDTPQFDTQTRLLDR